MRLKGKVAIITGGASGMGACEAEMLAKEGAVVVVADIMEDAGRQVEARINEAGWKAIFVQLDVTDEEQWATVIAQTVHKFGKIDILVNNAGISGTYQPDLMDSEAFDKTMTINSRGVFLGMKCAAKQMERSGGGAIVNISSISGLVGQEHVHMGYSASKGAVRLMTKAAAVQFAKKNIRVNSVHPGVMPPMVSAVGSAEPSIIQKQLASVPMGRQGLREEVAYAVLFLASDESSYITGVELPVDGGYTAQ